MQRVGDWGRYLGTLYLLPFLYRYFLAFLDVVCKAKMSNTGVFLKKAFRYNISTILLDYDLNLGKMGKQVTMDLYIPTDQRYECLTTSMLRFQTVTYLTWSWPWPVLSMSPLHIWHLHLPLRNTLAEVCQSVSRQSFSSLFSIVNQAKRVTFDLWPNLDPALDLFPENFRLL